jgi:lipopolysaccharide transport system ATP-binding protein
MSKPIVEVENVSKKFSIGTKESYYSLRDAMVNFATFKRQNKRDFWALRDINFSINQGDALAIIGKNGAGKSTLLKVISQITPPTKGKITMRGRVASLLEVGTGFHAELTGRENIFLNGAILGMSQKEIKKKFDEIVAFAEIEKFLDTPVKRYSSGMYVRLAFAVAAHLEPEILIVDEVLAVGDAQFQKKCLGKMQSVGQSGRTVIFVSHNMAAVKNLCQKGVLLEGGRLIDSGSIEKITERYLKSSGSIMEQDWTNDLNAPGNDRVKLLKVKVSGEDGHVGQITIDTPLKLDFAFNNFIPAKLNFSIHVFNHEGVCVFNTVSPAAKYKKGIVSGTCHIPANFLNDGLYRVMLMIVEDQSHSIFQLDDSLSFEVVENEREGNWYGKWAGIVRPALKWVTDFKELK